MEIYELAGHVCVCNTFMGGSSVFWLPATCLYLTINRSCAFGGVRSWGKLAKSRPMTRDLEPRQRLARDTPTSTSKYYLVRNLARNNINRLP